MPVNERSIFWSWNSSDLRDHEILARCVQEGLDEVSVCVKKAEEVLKANTHDRSFNAYDQGPDRVREQAKALYEYLQDHKPKIGTTPSYSWEPWDSTQTRQRIRLIRELLHYGRGTCIDWVLLLASCLAKVRLNPLIIITGTSSDRHAILGYWLQDRRLPKPVMMGEDLISFLQNRHYRFGVVNATRIPPDESGQRKPFYGKRLFRVEWSTFSDDLDSLPIGGRLLSPVSDSLRQVFLAQEIPLSNDARICREGEDGWWITDRDRTYVIRRSDMTLKVYDGKESAEWEAITHLPDSARPFVIGPIRQIQQIHPANRDQKILLVVDIRAARDAGIKPLRPLDKIGGHTLTPARHFQDRPELEEIKKWWRNEDTYGVLALVGVGGTGKTSLAHRFLAQLPPLGEDVDIREDGAEKDETLTIPDALFIWDFYRHPDVDQCATALYNYLTGEQVTKAAFEQVQDVLSKNWRGCRVLLMFDGVEKLQIAPGIEPEEEGGTFGQFLPEGAPLGRFLQWCCDGPRPAHVLLTSRFGLTDLQRYESTGGYYIVDLGDLPLESARALLRACGVEGSNWQLDELIREFRAHAQTLSLLGSALHIWCNGAPSRVNELPTLEDVRKLAVIRPRVWERVRVLRFYEKKLPSKTLEVLQLLTLFADLTLNERVNLMATVLQQDTIGLRPHMLALTYEYKLLPQAKPAEREWELHPALKDYFYLALNPDARAAYHSSLADLLFQQLNSAYLVKPQSWRDLSVMYELVHQLVAAKRLPEAYHVYHTYMGAYDHIAKLNAHTIGLRTAVEILNSPYVDALSPWQKARLLNDSGGFLRALGALEEGLHRYREAFRILQGTFASEESVKEGIRFNRSVALRNTARILVLQGRLKQAQAEAESAYKHERRVGDKEGIQIALCLAAYAIGLQGDAKRAFELYERARVEGVVEEMLQKEYAVHWAHLMLLSGMERDAFTHVTEIVTRNPPSYINHFCNLIAIVVTMRLKEWDFEKEMIKLLKIEEWARSVGRVELEIHAQLAKAELALRQLELATCEETLGKVIPLAEGNGYGLYWIDLQVVKGHWELACGRQLQEGKELPPELEPWTPQQWFERAEASALRALNGERKDGAVPDNKKEPRWKDEAVGNFAMLGAQHPECGYAWGEGDALHLLGEARFELVKCVGSNGYGSKDRPRERILEEARQAAEHALALRERIQDPKARETQDLLRKIREAQGGDKP